MTTQNQRRAFISYSRTNTEFATKLTKGLKQAGYPVWFDQIDIPTGSRWDDEVEKALRECPIFMIILTPTAIASDNVKDEIGYAIDHNKRILPILLEPCDVPFRLRRFQYVDFTAKSFDEGFKSARELLNNFANELAVSELSKRPVAVADSNESKPEPARAKPASVASAPKKSTPKGLVIGIVAVVALVIAGIGINSISNRGTPAVETPTEISKNVLPPATATATVIATEEIAPTATEAVIPTLSSFHTIDFDIETELSSWDDPFLTSGKRDKLNLHIADGSLIFDITGTKLWSYMTYKAFKYTDVRVDAVAVNLGMNENNISLICRFSEQGWYEFNIGNDGLYSILAGKGDIQAHYYDVLADGGSGYINTGQATNKYTAICKENSLTLLINDKEVRTVETGIYNYGEGKIGISVSSFNATPVIINFESVTIRQP